MIRRPPRSTLSSSSAASDVYKRQVREDRTQRHRPSQDVHQHCQNPGPDSSVGSGNVRRGPEADRGGGRRGDLDVYADITQDVAGRWVAGESHSAFLFGGTDQYFVDSYMAGTGD